MYQQLEDEPERNTWVKMVKNVCMGSSWQALHMLQTESVENVRAF